MPDPVDREAVIRRRFERETADHQLTVMRDDGIYRHLRIQEPGSGAYWFDLITWPGCLTVTGDCGTFVFARIQDMFEFFESPHGRINPHYWSEKLRAPDHRHVKAYAHEAFERRVRDWARDFCDDFGGADGLIYPSLLTGALDREVLDNWTDTEDEARDRLEQLQDLLDQNLDAWEWDLRDWDWQFLWCCTAIVDGIRRYREHQAASTTEAVAA